MNPPTAPQHTPGDWQVYNGNTRLCVETKEFPAKLVAIIYAGVDIAGDINDPEQIANAQLIASAPRLKREHAEMLAALKEALESVELCGLGGSNKQREKSFEMHARALIARIERGAE